MRRLALTLIPLLLVACRDEPTAPNLSRSSAPTSVLRSAGAGAQVIQSRFDVPTDFLYSPADYPCLTEPIQITGSFSEHDVLVVGSTEIHLTQHQSTGSVTATGVTTGNRYAVSVPLTFSGTAPVVGESVRELTFHNINHFVGPGPDANIYFRTLNHITFNPVTGEIKEEVLKDDVLCH